MEQIQVSVVCNAYNHEKYIRSALDGFVMQKTNFSYEVLIHDDASTDNTADIIKQYAHDYPDIIKPIYEDENQYSKHNGALDRIQYGRVKGRYIAICEGDDYWIDPYKLQKQYDALELNPEVDICATAAYVEKKGKIVGAISPKKENSIIPVNEVITGDGDFVSTATLMYRSTIREDNRQYYSVINIDYKTQIAGALNGGMLYLAENTAVYRAQTEGSWTERVTKNKKLGMSYYAKILKMLTCLNQDTNFAYSDEINDRIARYEFEIALSNGDYKSAMSDRFRSYRKKSSLRRKIRILTGLISPRLLDFFEHMF